VLLITEFADRSAVVDTTVTLAFQERQKARFRASLDSGADVGFQLERGNILRGGDKLQSDDNQIIQVIAANETVSTVTTSDSMLLARICYHLGNRHVPLQVMNGQCRYLHDHVLDDMVVLLGGEVECEQAPFEPEAGAYSGGGHAHRHLHHHSHEQS